jgi:RNA polymerase sigma-70 factor (ECF subfamily)
MDNLADRKAERDATDSVVRRCLAGEADAWRELVTDQQKPVYRYCWRFTRSSAEAEDLTQEVFIKIFRNLSSFDADKGRLRNWILNLTRNHVVDHFRCNKLMRTAASLDDTLYDQEGSATLASRLRDPHPTQEQAFALRELRASVQAAVDRLPAKHREVVIFCDLEEIKYKDVAEILHVPEGTVKSRLSRGRAELARLLAPTLADDTRAPVASSPVTRRTAPPPPAMALPRHSLREISQPAQMA